jgi:hypothetical protein
MPNANEVSLLKAIGLEFYSPTRILAGTPIIVTTQAFLTVKA